MIESEYRVEFEDVDCYGIAHHTALIRYLERARVKFFHEGKVPVDREDFSLVLAEMRIQFRKPLRLLDMARIQMGCPKVTSARVVLDYRILGGEDVVLEAQVTLASVDRQGLKPARIPEEAESLLIELGPLTPKQNSPSAQK